MFTKAITYVKDRFLAAKESFGDKKPHFNFITVHCKLT